MKACTYTSRFSCNLLCLSFTYTLLPLVKSSHIFSSTKDCCYTRKCFSIRSLVNSFTSYRIINLLTVFVLESFYEWWGSINVHNFNYTLFILLCQKFGLKFLELAEAILSTLGPAALPGSVDC